MRGKSASSFAQLLRNISSMPRNKSHIPPVGSGACDSHVDREETIIKAK